MFSSHPRENSHLGVLDFRFEGVAELGKLSFALAYAGDAEYMRVPDNRKALDGL